MQVGTYPTRNFAQFTFYVSIKAGLYLNLLHRVTNPKRIVSEDSNSYELVFPADCPHVFQIFTALKEERVLRSFGGVSRI